MDNNPKVMTIEQQALAHDLRQHASFVFSPGVTLSLTEQSTIKRDILKAADALERHEADKLAWQAERQDVSEAFKREVSDAMTDLDARLKDAGYAITSHSRLIARRFIIPASDPVAEALKAVLDAYENELISHPPTLEESKAGEAAALAKFRAFIEGGR